MLETLERLTAAHIDQRCKPSFPPPIFCLCLSRLLMTSNAASVRLCPQSAIYFEVFSWLHSIAHNVNHSDSEELSHPAVYIHDSPPLTLERLCMRDDVEYSNSPASQDSYSRELPVPRQPTYRVSKDRLIYNN